MRRKSIMAVLIAPLILIACGDDDDGGDTTAAGASTPATTAEPGTTAPAGTTTGTTGMTGTTAAMTTMVSATTMAPATTMADDTMAPTTASGGSVEGFCAAEVEAEAAVAGGDPAATQAAFEALSAAAPAEVKEAVDETIAAAAEMGDGPPTEAFNAAYGDLIAYVSGNCGFAEVDVLAKDYSFGGIGGTLEAGPTIVNLNNEGTELHEVVMLRKNDGVTESFEELLGLPEEEAMSKVTTAGAAFTVPGVVGHTVIDLTPGEYLAVCFLPVGFTPDVLEEMESGGAPPDGMPHFMKGMQVEFTVS